jgi:hypothetical protein
MADNRTVEDKIHGLLMQFMRQGSYGPDELTVTKETFIKLRDEVGHMLRYPPPTANVLPSWIELAGPTGYVVIKWR